MIYLPPGKELCRLWSVSFDSFQLQSLLENWRVNRTEPVDDDIAFVYCFGLCCDNHPFMQVLLRIGSKLEKMEGSFQFELAKKEKRIPSWHVRWNSHTLNAFVSSFFLVWEYIGLVSNPYSLNTFEYLIKVPFFFLKKWNCIYPHCLLSRIERNIFIFWNVITFECYTVNGNRTVKNQRLRICTCN